MFYFLAQCARTETGSVVDGQLTQVANNITEWKEVLTQANAHGLGPLLYAHLKSGGVSLPLDVKLELQGLYLRHRHANNVRARVLAEILTAYESAKIQVLLLKGIALAHLIYPEPGLRPMLDMDLLVHPDDAHHAQEILAQLGFDAPLPDSKNLPGKHMPNASRTVEGMLVSVEIHHNLFNTRSPVSLQIDDLTAPPVSFPLEDVTAYTLPHEEMLWHLCQHLLIAAQRFRLIWLADIVGLAERHAHDIDWARVKQQYPLVLSTLALFHYITPLSDTLQQAASLDISPVEPQGVGKVFAGWPHTSIGQQRMTGKSYGQILLDTFFPSEWWLRLYYGLGSTRSVFWQRWWGHPLQVLRWGVENLRADIAN